MLYSVEYRSADRQAWEHYGLFKRDKARHAQALLELQGMTVMVIRRRTQ